MTGTRRGARRRGLSLIEVLVALALLSIIATAIIATFSVTARINRDASIDVDYSRVVRSAMERVAVYFSDPVNWVDSEVNSEAALDTWVRALDEDCSAVVADPADATYRDVVLVVRIACGTGDGGLPLQVFEQEFPRP